MTAHKENKLDHIPPEDAQSPNSWSWKRSVPLAVLVLGTVLFFAIGWDEYLSFAALHEHDEMLRQHVANHLVVALVTYFVVYAISIALSLPGGLVLTVLGGYLFGTAVAGTTVIFAATIGATAIFLAAKTALGDFLRNRAGPAMQRMEAGIKKDAFHYLLVLRLIPLFPFFLVNLAPAFLGVSLRVYFFSTLIGIIPGTYIFASVGNGLGAVLGTGQEPTAKLLLEPEILLPLIGLAILAMVPVVYRRYKTKKNTIAEKDTLD